MQGHEQVFLLCCCTQHMHCVCMPVHRHFGFSDPCQVLEGADDAEEGGGQHIHTHAYGAGHAALSTPNKAVRLGFGSFLAQHHICSCICGRAAGTDTCTCCCCVCVWLAVLSLPLPLYGLSPLLWCSGAVRHTSISHGGQHPAHLNGCTDTCVPVQACGCLSGSWAVFRGGE